jgi:hypothetical protein
LFICVICGRRLELPEAAPSEGEEKRAGCARQQPEAARNPETGC